MLDQKEGAANPGFPKEEPAKPAELKNKSYFGVPSHKVKFSSLNKKVDKAAASNLETEEKKKPFDPFPKKKGDNKFKSFLLQRRTILIVAVIIFVLGMASLTPVITGQTVVSAQEVQRMETTLSANNLTITNLTKDLVTVKTSLDASKTAYDNLLTEKTDLTNKLSAANSELGSLKTKLAALEKTEQINKDLEKANYNLKDKVANLKDDLGDLQDDFDDVVGNSARSICCKKKIDDSTISSYKVKDDKVECLSSGGTSLDCSFS